MTYSPNTITKQSTDNTTTTPLGSGATYTGTGELVNSPDVMVVCKTDNSGTLYFDFSPDGSNWDSTFPPAGFDVAAGINEFHQGNLPINASIGADADATVVRSVSSELDLALGRFSGMSTGTKFGRVKNIDAADSAVDIWAFSDDSLSPRSDTKTFPSSADTIYVTSSSSSDTNVDVTVEYIDANGAIQTAEVNTNGQTPVSIGATGLDVNRMYVSGSTAAVGKIYASVGNDFTSGAPNDVTDILALIPIGYGQSQLSQYTVPSGKTLIITGVFITVSRASGSAGSADVTLRVKDSGGVSRVRREFFPTSSVPVDLSQQLWTYDAGAQIVWRVDDVSDSDTNISCIWNYYLVDV